MTSAPGKPPAAFCNAMAAVDRDFNAYILSGGKHPSQSQLRQDGVALGVRGILAGNPYASEVKQFSNDTISGNMQATLADLHRIEGQCDLPLSELPGSA